MTAIFLAAHPVAAKDKASHHVPDPKELQPGNVAPKALMAAKAVERARAGGNKTAPVAAGIGRTTSGVLPSWKKGRWGC